MIQHKDNANYLLLTNTLKIIFIFTSTPSKERNILTMWAILGLQT